MEIEGKWDVIVTDAWNVGAGVSCLVIRWCWRVIGGVRWQVFEPPKRKKRHDKFYGGGAFDGPCSSLMVVLGGYDNG
jgi:hypothetical protein